MKTVPRKVRYPQLTVYNFSATHYRDAKLFHEIRVLNTILKWGTQIIATAWFSN